MHTATAETLKRQPLCPAAKHAVDMFGSPASTPSLIHSPSPSSKRTRSTRSPSTSALEAAASSRPLVTSSRSRRLRWVSDKGKSEPNHMAGGRVSGLNSNLPPDSILTCHLPTSLQPPAAPQLLNANFQQPGSLVGGLLHVRLHLGRLLVAQAHERLELGSVGLQTEGSVEGREWAKSVNGRLWASLCTSSTRESCFWPHTQQGRQVRVTSCSTRRAQPCCTAQLGWPHCSAQMHNHRASRASVKAPSRSSRSSRYTLQVREEYKIGCFLVIICSREHRRVQRVQQESVAAGSPVSNLV